LCPDSPGAEWNHSEWLLFHNFFVLLFGGCWFSMVRRAMFGLAVPFAASAMSHGKRVRPS
jgi:hypothetical protein